MELTNPTHSRDLEPATDRGLAQDYTMSHSAPLLPHPAHASLPPIQPAQDDDLRSFPFYQFSAYNPCRNWTFNVAASSEAARRVSMASHPGLSGPPGPPATAGSRLPGSTELGYPASPPYPPSHDQSQSRAHSQNHSQNHTHNHDHHDHHGRHHDHNHNENYSHIHNHDHYGYDSHASRAHPSHTAHAHTHNPSHTHHPGVSVDDLYHPTPSVAPALHASHLPSICSIDPLKPPPPISLPGPSSVQSAPTTKQPAPTMQPVLSMPPASLPFPPMPPLPQQLPYPMPPQHSLPPIQSMPSQQILPPYRLTSNMNSSSNNPDFTGFRPALGFTQIPRHKKEIKRRTKTGCMTCRRRRIKCDETHPTCNNCKKSKRDCAGYNPIFEQQSQSPDPPQTAAQPPSATPVATAASASIASALAAVASPTATTLPTPSTTPTSVSNLYSSASSGRNSTSSASTTPTPSTYPPRSILSPTQDWSYPFGASGLTYRAKMKVDEIIGLAGPAPTPTAQPTHETLDDITKMYHQIYVPGLATFFETTWYDFKPTGANTPGTLLNNKALVDLLSAFLSAIARVETNDPNDPNMLAAVALETCVVWALASMVYSTPATVNLPSEESVAQDDAMEARNRMAVVEALLSGGCLRSNPCILAPRTGDASRIREHQFWWWLAEYLRLQDDAGLNTPANNLPRLREQALTRMRSLLDGRENRDTIYSIAILRQLAPRYASAGDMIVPPGHEDEADPRIKFAMATEFIRNLAQDYSVGLTNVGRRIAEIGLKAFVQPGYCIRRP